MLREGLRSRRQEVDSLRSPELPCSSSEFPPNHFQSVPPLPCPQWELMWLQQHSALAHTRLHQSISARCHSYQEKEMSCFFCWRQIPTSLLPCRCVRKTNLIGNRSTMSAFVLKMDQSVSWMRPNNVKYENVSGGLINYGWATFWPSEEKLTTRFSAPASQWTVLLPR